MANVTGRVNIRRNGALLATKEGATAYGIGGYKREPVMGSTGLHGFTEKPEPSRCEFSITDRDDFSLEDLAKGTNDTITFEAVPNGKVYIMRNAFVEGGFSVKEGDGEVPVVYFGDKWEEQLA